MTKHINTVMFFIIITSTFGYSQITAPDQIRIDAGLSIPNAPEQFYDYWTDGIHISAGTLYTTRYPYVGSISLGYNYFLFDKSQMEKKLNVLQGSTSVSGSSSTIYTLSSEMNYYFQGDPEFTPFVFAGLSFSYLYVSEATITYPLSEKKQHSSSKIFISFDFGGGVTYPISKGTDLVLSANHAMGLKKDKTVNTDFYTIAIGALWHIE